MGKNADISGVIKFKSLIVRDAANGAADSGESKTEDSGELNGSEIELSNEKDNDASDGSSASVKELLGDGVTILEIDV